MAYDNLERIVDAWLARTIDDQEFVRLRSSLGGAFGAGDTGERVWLGRQVDNPVYVDMLYLDGQLSEKQLERLEELIDDYE